MCLDNDIITITLIIILSIIIFSGYLFIAYKWSKAENEVPNSEAKKALNDLKWTFIICATCGYLFVLVKTVWPAWRLYAILMMLLSFVTWRYVLREESMDLIYRHLKDREDLVREIEKQQSIIKKLERSKKSLSK